MRPHTHSTSQRRAILQVLVTAETPLSAFQIRDRAHAEHPVALSTVYRTLALMRKRHWIRAVRPPLGPPCYKLGRKSGVYFFCLTCGQFVSLPPPHPTLHLEETEARGFRVEEFDLILRGRCSTCCSCGISEKNLNFKATPSRSFW